MKEMLQVQHTMLGLAEKSDMEKLQIDMARSKNLVADMEYKVNNNTTKVEDVDAKVESFQQFFRLENGRTLEKIEKLEAHIAGAKKIISELTKAIKPENQQKPDEGETKMNSKSVEELEKLKAKLGELSAVVEKNHNWMKIELDGKVSHIELQNV